MYTKWDWGKLEKENLSYPMGGATVRTESEEISKCRIRKDLPGPRKDLELHSDSRGKPSSCHPSLLLWALVLMGVWYRPR